MTYPWEACPNPIQSDTKHGSCKKKNVQTVLDTIQPLLNPTSRAREWSAGRRQRVGPLFHFWRGTNLDALPLVLGSGPYQLAAAVHTLAKTTRAAAGESQVLNTWQKQIGVALAGHRSLLPPPTSQFSIVSTLRSAVPPPPPDNRCPLRSSPTPPFSPPGAHKPPSPRHRWPGVTISAAGTRRSKQTGSSRVSCQVFFLS